MRTHSALVFLALLCGSALAQNNALSKPEEVMIHVREADKTAKTEREKDSIAKWCRDKIASLSFHEHNRLTVEALLRLPDNKIEEANALLERDKACK
jgi:hypothetical protein